jgi:hypothetical protein
MKTLTLISLASALCVCVQMPSVFAQAQAPASDQTPATSQAAAPVRIRARIEKIDGNNISVKDRRGEIVNLILASNLVVSEVYAIDISEIKKGSYVGSAAVPQADGSLRAIEVLVFPEAMRGVGEGHRGWDLMPQSTMTNATVDEVLSTSGGGTDTRITAGRNGFQPPM